MMTAEKLIRKYNKLNGTTITKSKLAAFYSELKKVKNNPVINGIKSRIEKVLPKLNGKAVTVALKPIALGKAKKVSRNVKVATRSRKVTPQLSKAGLYGLECDPAEGLQETKGLGFTKAGQSKIYDMVTDLVIKAIDKADTSKKWEAPWYGAARPQAAQNFVTRKPYRGVNAVVLNFIAPFLFNNESTFWMTFNQVKQLKGKIKKGSKAFPILFYSIYYKDASGKTIKTEDFKKLSEKEKDQVTELYTVNYYSVFGDEQIEGIEFPNRPTGRNEAEQIETAEAIVKGMPKAPPIIHHQLPRAFYRPGKDDVTVPEITIFKTDAGYYSTLFHELVHSTGHASRLKRFEKKSHKEGGKVAYAIEELVAELGASFLNAEAGILYHNINHSADYLKRWKTTLRKALQDDNKMFAVAAAQAQKASDFILDIDPQKVAKKKTADRKPVRKKETEKVVSKQTSLFGFTSAGEAPKLPAQDTFTIPGEVGRLLGRIQPFKYEIVLSGETHSCKSELAKQVANGFIEVGKKVGFVDWEHGGLESLATSESVDRNLSPANKNKLSVSGEFPRTLEAVKSLSQHFDVVILDSGSKLNQKTNAWIDELRNDHPETIWIPLMQQNAEGGTRGGSAAEFDSPVVIKTYKQSDDFQDNYAVVEKNRNNPDTIGLTYNIFKKKIIKPHVE